MPGPLPDPDAIRRNAPTIPTTKLPVSGRSGPVPKVPSWVALGKAGKAWWAWAWKTPQACGWGPGHEVMISRRASLEDDLTALRSVASLDAMDLLGADAGDFKNLVRQLAALATGKLAICKEIRELEDRLGLTPKGMAALRWTIVADPGQTSQKPSSTTDDGAAKVTDISARRARLTG